MAIFFNFSPTSSHLHPLQVENYGSNSRLVVDEDDNGKFRLERVKGSTQLTMYNIEAVGASVTGGDMIVYRRNDTAISWQIYNNIYAYYHSTHNIHVAAYGELISILVL